MTDIVDRFKEHIRAAEHNHGDEADKYISDASVGELRDAIAEIERLRALLKRIDAVTAWETTPLGRGFQDELEAVLPPWRDRKQQPSPPGGGS